MKKFSYLKEEAEEIINKTFDQGVDLPDADKVPVDSEREETDDVPDDVVESLTRLAARKEKQGKLEEAEQIRNTIKLYSEALT